MKALFCFFLGHQYTVVRRMNPGARKVHCIRCQNNWAMHDSTDCFVPWDGEFEELYAPGGALDMGTEYIGKPQGGKV